MSSSDSGESPDPASHSGIIKNRRAFLLLCFVLLCLAAAGLLLSNETTIGSGASPPWAAFLLIMIAAMVLLFHSSFEGDAATRSNQPAPGLMAQLDISHLAFSPQILYFRVIPTLLLAAAIGLTLWLLTQIPTLNRDADYSQVTLLWLFAMLLYTAAIAWPDGDNESGWRERAKQHVGTFRSWIRTQGQTRQLTFVLVLTIVILAALLLRISRLEEIPFTLSGDESSQGLEALNVINGAVTNPFTTGWYGVPTLSFYLNAITIRLFGASTLALRLPWALLGTMTVLVTYFLVKRLQNRTLALATAALVAVYHYHIHYSRLGSNQIVSPLFMALALLFLYRALDEHRPIDWALTGFISAFALYFYAGARLAPIVVVGVVAYLFLRSPREFWDQNKRGLLIMLVAFLIAGAPMLQYAYRYPDEFNTRVNQIGIIQSGWLDGQLAAGSGLVETLFDQFKRAVLAFNYYADRTVWYGLRQPLLDVIFGVVFLLGLGYGTVAMFGDSSKQRLSPMVIWWWSGIILGGMLTESPPSSMRLLVLSLPVCFFVILGMWQIIKLADMAFNRVPTKALLAGGILLFAIISLKTYFLDYTPMRLYGGRHAELSTTLAPIVNEHQETHQVHFFGAPIMIWDFPTLRYLAPDANGSDVMQPLEGPFPKDRTPDAKAGLFVFLPHRSSEIAFVQDAQPGGEVLELYSLGEHNQLMATLYIAPEE